MERTAWQLARLADCGEPDSVDSVGAQWLQRVAVDADEIRGGASTDEERQDWIAERSDSLVPVYTHERWQVFVDLAAYNEDVSEYGGSDGDLTAQAGVALYMIAERLLNALLEDNDED